MFVLIFTKRKEENFKRALVFAAVFLAQAELSGIPGHGFDPQVRAGVGLGWGRLADVEIIDQIQEHGDSLDETGLGILTSLGYEFRITSDVAAGLGVGFNYLSINEDFYESGWFTPLTGTLTWYWD